MPDVPDRSWFDPVLGATLHTGRNAVEAGQRFVGGALATDIETPGLESFTINCVTMAFEADGAVNSILLDPDRADHHDQLVRDMYVRADSIILHNASFDVPRLHHAGLITAAQINRIVDTVVLARFAHPSVMISKTLTAMVKRHLGMDELSGGMALAFKAAGYKTQAAGFENMDIDSPIYRLGAMADTVQTLRLEPILRTTCRDLTTTHPFEIYGAGTTGEADELIAVQETVNRVMLRRSAVGIAVDRDYLDRYSEQVEKERATAVRTLAEVGLEGGAGKGLPLVKYLDARGELPPSWPRTPTKQLRATKEDLEGLDHPLAAAQRSLAETDKIFGYLAKVERQASITGRCHPQVGILGASATGRMAYGTPELQQFPAAARPVLTDDGQGLTSLDWSQIEPVTMGLMAKDEKFLAPFESGQDLYAPIMRACGIDRPLAKVVLLATMYGQGPDGLSKRIGHTPESASTIIRQMMEAMPASKQWMVRVKGIAERHGMVITAGGRILPVDDGGIFKAVNYVVQGSAYDVLANTIVEMERAGIGDAVQLAMHDEVVVDTPVAEAVQQIMLTPPKFLIKWAGRTPVLRTDREDMNHHWAKV